MNRNIIRKGGAVSLSPASAPLAMVSSQGSASAAPAPRSSVLREIGRNIGIPSRSHSTAAAVFSLARDPVVPPAPFPLSRPSRKASPRLIGQAHESIQQLLDRLGALRPLDRADPGTD